MSLLDLLRRLVPIAQPHDQLDPGDNWGHAARQALDRMDGETQTAWLALLAHARTAETARPSGAWLAEAGRRVAALGEARFAATLIQWLDLLGAPPRNTTNVADNGHGTVPTTVLVEPNATLLKGLIWCAATSGDERLARAIGAAAECLFKKIPNVGARSVKAGNACVYVLGAIPGRYGIAELQRLRQRVTYASARQMIDATLDTAAARAGLTRDDLDDLAVPTFDLAEGGLTRLLGHCTAELVIAGVRVVELGWRAPAGKVQRSAPAVVERDYPDEVKALKGLVKDIRVMLPVQRERLERLMATERDWLLADWRARYLDHPLLCVLTRRLIWWFQTGDRAVLGAWHEGTLVDVDDRPLTGLTEATRVRLWHPIGTEAATVLAWRGWLERHGVTQPFKQAHREVYLLTDAELATGTYSNRFAAHILRQHQMRALAQARGWRCPLQGDWDSGDVWPTLDLPAWGLRADFWVESVRDGDQQRLLSDAGVCLFVSTDQVRYTRLTDGQPVPLAEVPALVFSEVMRDVDLFVGVASVGNDPTWRDSGPLGHRAYWDAYAFGDLGESAKTRRVVLERLLPRLTIADRCVLTDRFLVVRGALRTYRIHLGSGNILMEPNNQYLCIVPDRRMEAAGAGTICLPFEGDHGLALILSKAFLLARDTTITDPTIARQIKGQ